MLKSAAVVHSKNCWVVLTQLWVKYGKPNHWVKIFNYIFNPMAEFVHI